MKGLKRFIFLLAFVFVLPLFGIGCGELKFEDVPYEASSYTNAEGNTVIVTARNQFKSLGIKSKIQTTNTYKFFATTDETVENREVKDVITTYLCVEEYGEEATVSSVETIRYINNKKNVRELKTYVDSTSDYTDYCYTLTEFYNEDGEVISTKNRAYYDSGRYSYSNLFDSAFVSSQAEEIDNIYTKSFEGTTYYKFESKLLGLTAVNERFEKNENIEQNPSLFTSIEPNFDTVIPFCYEYGINSSGYLVHAKVNYSITNYDDEKYLTVESVSKIESYGDSIKNLEVPEDIDDYTAETLITTLNQEKSYVTYRNTIGSAYTKTIVGKIGSDENPDYTVKVENYQSNSVTSTNYYYVKYEITDSDSSENEPTGKYQSYSLNIQEKTFTKCDYVLDLLNFDFSLEYNSTSEKDGTKTYRYGSNAGYVDIKIVSNEISSIVTETTAQTEIFIENYGNDFVNTNLNLIESLTGYTEVVAEETPEETPEGGDSGSTEGGGDSSTGGSEGGSAEEGGEAPSEGGDSSTGGTGETA